MPGTVASLLLIALIGYLWGSIPSGYWMGKLLRGKDFDIRDYGSHKTGATNVRRTLGNGPAIIVLLVDLSKGLGPALIGTAPFFYHGGWGPAIAGLLAFLGHCFPVFIGFRGGRGVMTGGGSMLVFSPLAFLIAAITTIGTIAIWRYVSLGSIVGSLTVIICGIVFGLLGRVPLPYALAMVVIPLLVILFHRDNISRLLAGTESKLGQKVAVPENPVPSKAP